MIKAIIFDWHGVLDATTFHGFLQKLSELSGLPNKEIETRLAPFERQYIVGEMEPSTFWDKLQKYLKLTDRALSQAQEYRASIEKNEDLWKLFPKLKNGYTLGVLSDVSQDKVNMIRQKADLSFFTAAHFSCERHLSKHSLEFFRGILQELRVAPEETLYVDDSEKHIQTAKSLGLQTCLFRRLEDLLQLLSYPR